MTRHLFPLRNESGFPDPPAPLRSDPQARPAGFFPQPIINKNIALAHRMALRSGHFGSALGSGDITGLLA